MILEIKKYPDPILKKKAEAVKEINEGIRELGQNMVETMAANQGVGLAASQVGQLKRIIVVQPVREITPEEMAQKKPRVFINPKIIKKSKDTLIAPEGCLSFPGMFLDIKRAKEIEGEALNERGEKISLKLEGLPARIFQHEIDHLEGVLFIDRRTFWQKLWQKIKK